MLKYLICAHFNIALDLLKSVNFSVDPCQDFFEFSCGQWLADNPIPPSSSSVSHFDELITEVNNVTQGKSLELTLHYSRCGRTHGLNT